MEDKIPLYNNLNSKRTSPSHNESDDFSHSPPKLPRDLIISNTIEDLSPLNSIPLMQLTIDPRYTHMNSHSWPLTNQSFPSSLPIASHAIPSLPSLQDFYKRPIMESNSMLFDPTMQGLSKRLKHDSDEVIDLSELDNFTDRNNNNYPSNELDSVERKPLKYFDLTSEGIPSSSIPTSKTIPVAISQPKPHVKHKHNDTDKEEWLDLFKLVKEQVINFRNKEGKSKNSPNEFKKMEFPRFLHDDKLRSWLNHQCKLQKQGGLTKDQHDMLVDIGFDFMQRRALRKNQWDEQYEKLKLLKEQHGTCEVPAHYGDKGLKVWVNDQRKNFRNGALRKNKVDMLNALGFSWEAPSRIAKSSSHEMDSEISISPNASDPIPPIT